MNFDQEVFKEAMSVVETWEFTFAVEKLMDSEPAKWSEEKCNAAVRDYKRYMAVTKALGGIQLVPNSEIDEIWHMHILDTRAYMKDCEELFGEFLHHYPYFGMLNDENKQQWVDVQNTSEKLWNSLFGEPLYKSESSPQKCPQVCPCHVDATMFVEMASQTGLEKIA